MFMNLGNDRKSVITSASVQNEFLPKIEEVTLFNKMRSVALRFENLKTSSCCFFKLKDLSLDNLAM